MNHHFEAWRDHVRFLHEKECRIPAENLGLDRSEMPQIEMGMIQNFIIYLQDQKVEVFKTRLPVSELKPSQGQLDWDKVQTLYKKGYEALKDGVPIFVGQDHIICDGHHRFYALKLIDPHADIPVYEVQMDALPLINQMKRFLDSLDDNNVRDP